MFSVAVSTAHAQSKLTADQKKELESRFEQYKAKLGLTPDQQTKVKAIDSTYFVGLKDLKQSSDGKLAKFRKFKSLSSAKDTQMKGVLNAQQFEEYQQFKSEMRSEMAEMKARKN